MTAGRVAHFVGKRVRAHRLGIPLGRSRHFRLPASIVIDGERKTLKLPDEPGVKVAFMELLLADNYGLAKAPREIKTVLDIGAHVGIFCIAARAAFPHAIIHSYEPNPNLEQYLNVQAHVTNSRYFLEAVDLHDGKVALDIHEDSVRTRSRRDETGAINAVAFRKVIERLGGRVDLVKLDCEGAEWRVLQDHEAWHRVEHVSMEYHLWPSHTHDEAARVLRDLGFTILHQSRALDIGLIRASRRPAQRWLGA